MPIQAKYCPNPSEITPYYTTCKYQIGMRLNKIGSGYKIRFSCCAQFLYEFEP